MNILSLTIEDIFLFFLSAGPVFLAFYKKNEWIYPIFRWIKNKLSSINCFSNKKVEAVNAKLEQIIKELKPNGGTSIKDSLNRVENKLFSIENEIIFLRKNDIILANSLDIPIFKTDANGKCVWVSSAYTEFTGIDLEDAIGDGWANVIYYEDREKVYKEWDSAVRQNRNFKMEFRYQNIKTQQISRVLVESTKAINNGITVGYAGYVKKL